MGLLDTYIFPPYLTPNFPYPLRFDRILRLPVEKGKKRRRMKFAILGTDLALAAQFTIVVALPKIIETPIEGEICHYSLVTSFSAYPSLEKIYQRLFR